MDDEYITLIRPTLAPNCCGERPLAIPACVLRHNLSVSSLVVQFQPTLHAKTYATVEAPIDAENWSPVYPIVVGSTKVLAQHFRFTCNLHNYVM